MDSCIWTNLSMFYMMFEFWEGTSLESINHGNTISRWVDYRSCDLPYAIFFLYGELWDPSTSKVGDNLCQSQSWISPESILLKALIEKLCHTCFPGALSWFLHWEYPPCVWYWCHNEISKKNIMSENALKFRKRIWAPLFDAPNCTHISIAAHFGHWSVS